MSKVRLISFPDNSPWVKGEIEGREFGAKLFDEPSGFGINNGRVSKMWIDGIANYDRGWDFGEDDPLINDVVDYLEATPKRFEDWDKSQRVRRHPY